MDENDHHYDGVLTIVNNTEIVIFHFFLCYDVNIVVTKNLKKLKLRKAEMKTKYQRIKMSRQIALE